VFLILGSLPLSTNSDIFALRGQDHQFHRAQVFRTRYSMLVRKRELQNKTCHVESRIATDKVRSAQNLSYAENLVDLQQIKQAEVLHLAPIQIATQNTPARGTPGMNVSDIANHCARIRQQRL